MSYQIKNIDSVKYIKELKERGKEQLFNAVITDPPYNISRKNNFATIGRKGISFGTWDYGFDQTTWIYEVAPLVKDGGSMVIFNDYKNMGEICKALTDVGFEVKDLIRWVKNNPMPRNTSRRYVTDYEFAIWAVKPGSKWTFNKGDGPYRRPEYKFPLTNTGKHKFHPTQKPIQLMEAIIKTHTNKGDLIFDPFMGSASTGVAALSNERSFVGTEIDKKYFDKSELRLEETFAEKLVNSKVIRSPLYYLGDKSKLFPQFYKYLPEKINNYYDPFGGGASLFANVKANKYFYNDMDKNLARLVQYLHTVKYSIVKKGFDKVTKEFKLTNPTVEERNAKEVNSINKPGYNLLKEHFNEAKEWTDKKLIMFLVLIVYGFNSQIRFNSKGDFNIPVGKQDLNIGRDNMLRSFINAISAKEIKFSSKDYKEFLSGVKFKKNDFVYLDPPYSITNATYNVGWTSEDDNNLFALLDRLDKEGVKWAMSNVFEAKGNTNLGLMNWSEKYYVKKMNFDYKNSNYQRKSKGKDVEVMVANYEI